MIKILELLNDKDENASLLDVLESYAAAAPDGNDFAVLREWIKRFPQFAQELTDFAAERDLLEHAPLAEIEIADEEKYLAASRQTLQKFLAVGEQPQNAPDSLLSPAREKGVSMKKMASIFFGSVSLLMYFENRSLDAESVSRKILRKLAEVLQTSEEAIVGYLNQTPKAANASFKAQNRPAVGAKKSFADAVREDETLSAEQKKSLLDLSDE